MRAFLKVNMIQIFFTEYGSHLSCWNTSCLNALLQLFIFLRNICQQRFRFIKTCRSLAKAHSLHSISEHFTSVICLTMSISVPRSQFRSHLWVCCKRHTQVDTQQISKMHAERRTATENPCPDPLPPLSPGPQNWLLFTASCFRT